MDDPLNDPRFPQRPSHPDFWKLSEAITYLDGQALEGGNPIEDIVEQYIDLESIVYMANQRITRVLVQGVPVGQHIMLALYLDAFTLGCRVTDERRSP